MVPDPTSSEPRWRRLPEERPRQIIEAALDVFSEHGLSAARLEDIAKRAGVSKGTIYLYFPNKETLFCEMIRQMVGEAITRAQVRISSSTDSATDQFVQYMRAMWKNVRSPTFDKLYRIVEGDLKSYPTLLQFFIKEVSMRSMSLVASIIRHGMETGEFREVDPEAVARIHHAMMAKHGIWCGNRERIPFLVHLSDDEVLDQLLDVMLHSIQRWPALPSTAPDSGAAE